LLKQNHDFFRNLFSRAVTASLSNFPRGLQSARR